MTKNNLRTSAKMALILGVLLPIAETIRRANQILDPANFFKWFDDYILGFILIVAAYRVLKRKPDAVLYLIAVWGMAVGGHFLSFLGQFEYYKTPTGDPGLFSTTLVAVVKGTILIYMLIGVYWSIKANSTFVHGKSIRLK
jgi:hypothetical protein